jgi:predicted ATPase
LEPLSWSDDGYLTLYQLWFCDGDGAVALLGQVKIGYADLVRQERPLEKGKFSRLDELDGRLYWFSVGQDSTYYENIRTLSAPVRTKILERLCDIALSADLFDQAAFWDVTQTSLLRSVEPQTVEGQFRRIAQGGSWLTAYDFDYVTAPGAAEPVRLSFSVKPRSWPPTNIHVLIGRNGVGKTTLLGNIAEAVVHPDAQTEDVGRIVWAGDGSETFTNVVSVTFSAFDPAQEHAEAEADIEGNEESLPQLSSWDADKDLPGEQLPPAAEQTEAAVSYTYVGLAKVDDFGRPTGQRKSYEDLSKEFTRSVEEVAAARRIGRWMRALDVLSSDPLFDQSPIHDFARSLQHYESHKVNGARVREIFSSLSAGHAIVLLTITRLVETVAEQSLVLLDEPEAHLHPPLLASFVRALSDLMTDRNGVALIGTHSPVVLQEVPRSCVWKVSPYNRRPPRRPAIETYGENVGVLTHEIFGLEVRQSGFHAEITKAVDQLGSYEQVLDRFGGQLGGEAKGLVRILLAHRDADGHS